MSISNQKPTKPSDFSQFVMTVYTASATKMDFESYYDIYEELLKVLFWNPDIDTQIAINEQDEDYAHG